MGGSKDMFPWLRKVYVNYSETKPDTKNTIVVVTNKLAGVSQEKAYGNAEKYDNLNIVYLGVAQLDGGEADKNVIGEHDGTARNIIKDFEDLILKPLLEQNAPGKMQIHIDLESVKEADGVTEPRQASLGAFGALNSSLVNQFNIKDVCQVLQIASQKLGRDKLGGISVSDFNPIIEDQRTGRCVAHMFYMLCIGIC